MSERDYLAKEEALRRLSQPEGDHELHTALERMRADHPHLWEVLHRVHLAHDTDPEKLEQWRKAPEGSQEEIWAEHYDKAMGVLQMSLQQLQELRMIPQGGRFPLGTPIVGVRPGQCGVRTSENGG